MTNPTPPRDDAPERDVQYLAAVGLMLVSQRASTSYLSRCLNTGYNTAVGIMERLQADGIVSAPNHVSKREVLIRRADQPARVVVAPYTPEVGQAGEDYIKSVAFKGHHDLPAQFRWFALWDAMNAAALLPTEAGAEPGESELDEAWKSGFNAGFGEAMLTKDATPPAATTDTKALVEAMECLPRSTMNCGTEWVRLEEVRAALSREAPPAAQDVHPDDIAVDRFAAAMKAKLAKKREDGRGGWEGPECNEAVLSGLLRNHVEKGDPLDVGNLAMMLHQRGERISAQPTEADMPSEYRYVPTFTSDRTNAAPPAAPTDNTALVEAAIARMPLGKIAEIKRRWSGTDGTALSREAPQAATVDQMAGLMALADRIEKANSEPIRIDPKAADAIRALGGRT